jgi:hypothetical protein
MLQQLFQLSSQGKSLMRGRISSIFILIQTQEPDTVISYDKEKYRNLLLDAAEKVLVYFGFDGSIYKPENRAMRSSKQNKWWNELKETAENEILRGIYYPITYYLMFLISALYQSHTYYHNSE